MNAIDSGSESDDEPMYTEMLEDISEGSKSHPNVNRRETHYRIFHRIKQIQSECKGALKSTRNTVKGLYKVFKTAVKDISQDLPPLGESGSEISNLIPDPRNFDEVTKLSDEIRKPYLKSTQKGITNLTNNQNFLVEQQKKKL